MKYVKMLVLAVAAAAALAAFIGGSTASATVLCSEQGTGSPTGTTCPANRAYVAGTEIHAVNEGISKTTTSFMNVECEEATLSGKTQNEGSATETVKFIVEVLTFAKCNCEVKVLKAGTLEIHWIEGSHNGTVTSNDLEETWLCSTVFGSVHCIYRTTNTDLGTLTGSATTGQTATMDIESAGIPRVITSSLCPDTENWDVKYKITTPDALNVTGHT
jgi:hypothetical protein